MRRARLRFNPVVQSSPHNSPGAFSAAPASCAVCRASLPPAHMGRTGLPGLLPTRLCDVCLALLVREVLVTGTK